MKQNYVTENTVLEVGKFYNVRCAEMVDWRGQLLYYVPIIGKRHSDKQFGVEVMHYHVDGRFVSHHEKGFYQVNNNGLTNVICTDEFSYSHPYIKKIVIKRRKCKRLTTGINPPSRNKRRFDTGELIGSKYWAWYDSMIGKSCKGRKCPHLGTKMLERR